MLLSEHKELKMIRDAFIVKWAHLGVVQEELQLKLTLEKHMRRIEMLSMSLEEKAQYIMKNGPDEARKRTNELYWKTFGTDVSVYEQLYEGCVMIDFEKLI